MGLDEYENIDRPVRLAFRFTEAEANALGNLARASGVTLAALVRSWLYAALDTNPALRASREGHNNANRTAIR
jgi:hypothetical protein